MFDETSWIIKLPIDHSGRGGGAPALPADYDGDQPAQRQPRLRAPPPARDGQDQEVLRQNQSEDYGPNCYQCEQEFDGFSYWYQQETINRIKIKMEINTFIHFIT